VYNIGGGRFSNCSMLEAIEISENVTGREMRWTYDETARMGDHMWWVSDLSAFQADYPDWKLRYDVPAIINEIYERNVEDWRNS
jgi:CDP-paratose 2-epimerase